MFLKSLVQNFIRLLPALEVDTLSPGPSFAEWSGWGGNIYNNRWASQNRDLSKANVDSLASHCKISYPIGVSATVVLSGELAYYPTWNGSYVALNYHTCHVLWQINVTAIIYDFALPTPLQKNTTRPVSRTSAQIDGEVLFFGTQMHALLVAVDRFTGKTLGIVQTNQHPLALVTMSPTFYSGRLFVGVSSFEEVAADNPDYVCCSFVGNMLAFKFDRRPGTFEVLWNISTIPEAQAAQGWAGASLWGSQPSIDTRRGQVLIATGNSYSFPEAILECQKDTANLTAVVNGLVPDPCLPQDVLQESIIAIDVELGIINWVHQLPSLDAWTLACGAPGLTIRDPALCPETPGLDADFGMAPIFIPGSPTTPYGKDIVVIGQKNGNLYALSAQAGRVFWSTATSPDGLEGGLNWGIAADDRRVYFTAINSQERDWRLQPSNKSTSRSAYGAASLLTGALLWETASPADGFAIAPPTVVGDLVLVAKTGSDPNGTFTYDDTRGSLIAMDKKSGKIISQFELDAPFHGGIAVKNRNILFGTGYFSRPVGVGSLHVLHLTGYEELR